MRILSESWYRGHAPPPFPADLTRTSQGYLSHTAVHDG
jgi:hypothetical protein